MTRLSNLLNPLRAVRRGLSRFRSRTRRTLETEFSYHRLEQRWFDLSFWRDRTPLRREFLFVFKKKALSDHFLPAMLSYMKAHHSRVAYLGFSRDERPRDDPGRAAGKFYRSVDRSSPDVIFAYDSPLSAEEARFIQARGIQLASNTIGLDSFFSGGASSQAEAFEILRSYDWYYVSHAPHVPRLREEGVNAFALPMAYEPRWFYPLKDVEPRYDVLFVGDIFTPLNCNRRDLLAHVSRHFRVTMLSYRPPDLDNVDHIGVEVNPYRLNRILNQTRIVLGSDRVGDISSLNTLPEQYIFYDDEFYLRQRAYLTLGSGACYMVERHPEIARQFEDGREIVLWDDYDELCEHIAHYLEHDEERRAVGLAGHRRALAEHTTAHMMRFALQQMGLVDGGAD